MMTSTKRFGLGTAGGTSFGRTENMKSETRVVRLQEQPDKQRVAVMLLGRPGVYYATSADPEMVERLRKAHAARAPIQIEWDPNNLQILNVGTLRSR